MLQDLQKSKNRVPWLREADLIIRRPQDILGLKDIWRDETLEMYVVVEQ